MSIKDNYTVKSIKKKETHEWLLKKHYAKRVPSITYALGLFNSCNVIQGIVTFGYPMASQLQQAVMGKFKVIELNRLVTNDDLPKNATSYFVSNAIKKLPKPLCIVSYADSGEGHHGYIYQATNWIYTGMGSGGWGWAVKGMEGMHHTSIEDSVGRYENRTKDVSLESLLRKKYGDNLYKKKESEKHRYFYFHGSKTDKKIFEKNFKYCSKPYPKGKNINYDASYSPNIQATLF